MTLIRAVLPTAGKRLVKIQDSAQLVEAARLLSEKEASLVVVCDSQGLMRGVVTKSDVVKQISHCQGCSCTTTVTEVMSKSVIACHPDEDLYDVWLLMKEKGLKQIPVADESSRPLGLLYVSAALEVLMKEVEYEDLHLRDYVMGIGYR
ncbi:CBS domain-containing protein [Parapusillimonas sp. SGNA-6]|jgi:CBS domain-containing protein|nr:CBS domain-containing protein [Parapusillimonas sp. SGNA-6]